MTLYTVDTLLSLVLLSVLFAFGSSRVPALIKVMAFQGIVVSIIPFFITPDMETGAVIFTLATLVIRGAVIPLSLHIAIKKSGHPAGGVPDCGVPCLSVQRAGPDRGGGRDFPVPEHSGHQ